MTTKSSIKPVYCDIFAVSQDIETVDGIFGTKDTCALSETENQLEMCVQESCELFAHCEISSEQCYATVSSQPKSGIFKSLFCKLFKSKL